MSLKNINKSIEIKSRFEKLVRLVLYFYLVTFFMVNLIPFTLKDDGANCYLVPTSFLPSFSPQQIQ